MDREFAIVKDKVVIIFGKYRGEYLKDIAIEDRDYLKWLLNQDISKDFKKEIKKVLDEE